VSFVLILTAAGESRRLSDVVGHYGSKALLPLGKELVLVRTLKAFQDLPGLESIFVTVPNDLQAEFESAVQVARDRNLISDDLIINCIVGGQTRQSSVLKALLEVEKTFVTLPERIWVHDAARCFVERESLTALLEQSVSEEALSLGVYCQDAVKQIDEHAAVKISLPRSELMLVQTPQVFSAKILLAAHKAAAARNDFSAADDAELVEALCPVRMVLGTKRNFKLTTSDDYSYAQFLLAEMEK
jgi:2-C-methyl-D-erythritol 4-phosphate cytidylyltransferase